MKPELVLKDCRAVINGEIVKASIGISQGKISAIKKILSGEKEIDCSRKLVLPGLIDPHVHFRVPGAEYKADWKHESRAALHGGVTCVLDMPNNKPGICTSALLEEKRKTVKRTAGVDFGLHFGASPKHLDEIPKAEHCAAVKAFMGSSTGDLLIEKREDQLKAFSISAENKKIVMVHAEDEATIRKNSEKAKKNGWDSVKFHSKIRPPEAELISVKQALEVRKEAGNRLHICHVSNSESIPFIGAEKPSGMVSCGVTPNHLFLCVEDLEGLGNLAKVNPPVGTRQNRVKLWEALNSGAIDIIESDHAPHTEEEKNAPFPEAPSGIPGIETTLPLLLDAFHRKLISLERISEMCCSAPAELFGIKNKGFIKEGYDADFAVIDLKKEHKVDSGALYTKCGWSPFDGRELKGFVEKTFLRGELRHDSGQVFSGKGLEVETG